MGLTKLVVSLAVPLPKLESFQRYLFFGPHPDDIEIGAGATAAKLVSLGKNVRFVICTDGRFGDEFAPDNISGDALALLRQKESISSAEALGVKDVKFLNFSDGGAYDTNELFKAVMEEIGDFQADIVFAPDPCVSSECHTDHLNVGQVVRRAACFAPYPGIADMYGAKNANVKAIAYYMTAKPNAYVGTKETIKKQFIAIFDCHQSQFPPNSSQASSVKSYLEVRSIEFGIRSLKGRAEGFRVLGLTHMHCLPEAGT